MRTEYVACVVDAAAFRRKFLFGLHSDKMTRMARSKLLHVYNSLVAAACFYSSASLRRSAFSATMRWSMQSWMFPSMNAARL